MIVEVLVSRRIAAAFRAFRLAEMRADRSAWWPSLRWRTRAFRVAWMLEPVLAEMVVVRAMDDALQRVGRALWRGRARS